MTNINNQSLDLFALDTVQDLDNQSAAAVSGGGVVGDVTLWSAPSVSGSSLDVNSKVADLSTLGFANITSSIQVNNGQTWRFYTDKNFQGQYFDVGPDTGLGSLPSNIDNNIESLQAIS
jgi:hypothetical protein